MLCVTSLGVAQTAVYSCVDKNGRRITADRPIAECLDREQRILDKTGTERRRIGPTLTENERTQLEAERRAEAEQKSRVVEQRRRERALIARFPDEATHSSERVLAMEPLNDQIALARKRIEQLKADRGSINTELEFYQNDPKKAPARLQGRIQENDADVAEQQRFIAMKQEEKRKVQERFDVELAQLKELWAAEQRAAAKASTPSAAAPSAAASGAR